MARPKTKPLTTRIEAMLDEASWLLSHAQALADYGRQEEAAIGATAKELDTLRNNWLTPTPGLLTCPKTTSWPACWN